MCCGKRNETDLLNSFKVTIEQNYMTFDYANDIELVAVKNNTNRDLNKGTIIRNKIRLKKKRPYAIVSRREADILFTVQKQRKPIVVEVPNYIIESGELKEL